MATRFRTSGIQMGTSNMDVSGSAPSFPARAWANFDTLGGTRTLRASGNVTSVQDTGAGRTKINFTTAMPSVNYAVVCTARAEDSAIGFTVLKDYTNTTLAVEVYAFRLSTGEPWGAKYFDVVVVEH